LSSPTTRRIDVSHNVDRSKETTAGKGHKRVPWRYSWRLLSVQLGFAATSVLRDDFDIIHKLKGYKMNVMFLRLLRVENND